MAKQVNNQDVIKLQKFFMEFTDKAGDNKQYQQECLDGNGLRKVDLPFGLNTFNPDEKDFCVKLYKTDQEFDIINDYEFFRNFIVDRDLLSHDRRMKDSKTLKWLGIDYLNPDSNENREYPSISYQDVTERDMFGYPVITSSELRSEQKGIFSHHGFRKFEFEIRNLDIVNASDINLKVSLFWNQLDNVHIDPLFEEEIRYNEETKKIIAYINTNKLGNIINDNTEVTSKHPNVKGRFELHLNTIGGKNVYSFPVEIVVHNTAKAIEDRSKDALLEKSFVSIDFGTSSTCAAIKSKGKNKLFTLSGIDKRHDYDDNAYENPTNLMIYNWDEIYNQWQQNNKNFPFFLTKSDVVNEKYADYDSGYTVEDEYKDVDAEDGRRKMSAILTQLKMIPYWIANGVETKFVPYNSKDRMVVTVVDGIDGNDGKKYEFNPIAFYGYLLSRAINNPTNGKIFRSYQITYPVKFKKEIIEKISAALEYGIKRALPKSIRDGFDKNNKPLVDVKMVYSEPVACVGAIVGKQLKINADDKKPKLWSVYDLGGGTMDFALGMFREAIGDEIEDYEYCIEVFHVDGDSGVGGEKLIHRIAFEVYKNNRDTMVENNIKFVLPEGELTPKGFEGLLSFKGDEIADTNVNIIKENLARHLFKSATGADSLTEVAELEGIADDSTHCRLTLKCANGEYTEITLLVENIDAFIKSEINKTIEAFDNSLEQCFSKNVVKKSLKKSGVNLKYDDIAIFLGGNASKQHYVEELMREKFPKNRIERIGENLNDEEVSDEYKINEKTAVAFGQLELANLGVITDAIKVSDDTAPFQFTIGYKDVGSGEFIPVLRKSTNDSSWHKANRVNVTRGETELYYTTSPTCDANTLKPLNEDVSDYVEDKKKTLFIRVYNEDSIEYRIGSVNEVISNDEPVNTEMIIRLVDESK